MDKLRSSSNNLIFNYLEDSISTYLSDNRPRRFVPRSTRSMIKISDATTSYNVWSQCGYYITFCPVQVLTYIIVEKWFVTYLCKTNHIMITNLLMTIRDVIHALLRKKSSRHQSFSIKKFCFT